MNLVILRNAGAAALLAALLGCDLPGVDSTDTSGGETTTLGTGGTSDVPLERCECWALCEEINAMGEHGNIESIVVEFDLLPGYVCGEPEFADLQLREACQARTITRGGASGEIYTPVEGNSARLHCKKINAGP